MDERRHRAPIACLLSLATAATAHVDGGGRLPDVRSTLLLATCLALVWFSQRRRRPGLGGLLALLVQGQLIGHLAYSVTWDRPAAVITRQPQDLSSLLPPGAVQHAAHQHGGAPMAGMDHSSPSGALTMLLCHATAVALGLALALAVEGLALLLGWFAARATATATPVVPLPCPVHRPAWAGPVAVRVAPRERRHPRRGPPALA